MSIGDRLAYVPGDVALWPGLTGGQSIDLLGRLQGHLDRRRRDELIERFDLDPTKRARGYSKGNRQKVALIAALACRAECYLLDEPTSGLDPLMEEVFQQCVRELRDDDGATILLSSHILSEVEGLCDRVSIIRHGQMVRTGTLAELAADQAIAVQALIREPVGTLPAVSGFSSQQRAGGWQVGFRVHPEQLDAAIGALHTAGLLTLSVAPPTLDELFMAEYQTRGASTESSARRSAEGVGR